MYNCKWFNDVLDYIEHHLDRDLSLKILAEMAGLSPYYFHRLFKEKTGETLYRYVRRKRLEYAAHLLEQDPTLSMEEIAEKTGFSSSFVFSRNFKKYFGLTPSTFRKREKK